MLCYEFNSKILKLAPKFEAKDHAPSTFEDLKSSSGIIWAGASDQTIYGDPHVNHAFRAWRDSLHIKLNASFTLQGERLVGLEQARLIGGTAMGDIIVAEVIGQAVYFDKHGSFPIDQNRFLTDYMKGLI